MEIANTLDIKIKDGAKLVENAEISNKAGHNTNPKIINIDNIFKGVTKENANTFRKQAIEKALKLFRDKTVSIKDTNTVADINKSGIDKTFSGRVTDSKIQSANNIKQIIQEGIYKYTTTDINKKDGVLYHHFLTPVNYEGENGLIRVVIKEFTKDANLKDKYYYHQLEFVDNKNAKKRTDSTLVDIPAKAHESIPANNIPQNEQKVKNDISTKYSIQNKEKNTQELDNSSFSLKHKQ